MACSATIFAKKESLYLDCESMTVDEAIRSAFEAVLPEDCPIYGKEGTAEVEIDGAADPDGLRKAVEGWNERIKQTAIRLATEWLKDPALNTTKTYQLKVAMKAADNDFDYGVEDAVIELTSWGSEEMRTLIPEKMMEDALANPADYAVVNVAYDD